MSASVCGSRASAPRCAPFSPCCVQCTARHSGCVAPSGRASSPPTARAFPTRRPGRLLADIKGDVEDIERADGRTEVVVDEGLNTASYLLDEGLIAFGTAIDDRDHDGAMDILEGLELSSETEAMWRRLGDATLEAGHLLIAQRCAAAVGDIARARFLHKTAKIARLAEQKLGTDGRDFWMVRARLAQLRGDFDEAEGVFLDAGKTDEAVMMYQTMHRFDEAIAVAESRGHGDTERMKREYLDFLLRSGQEDKAAEIKEVSPCPSARAPACMRASVPVPACVCAHTRTLGLPAFPCPAAAPAAHALLASRAILSRGSLPRRRPPLERSCA